MTEDRKETERGKKTPTPVRFKKKKPAKKRETQKTKTPELNVHAKSPREIKTATETDKNRRR